MSDTTAATKPRSVYRNIHVTDILKYRLPPAGMVSIGHRISGVMMFLLLPFVVWLFDVSLTSEVSYERFTSAYLAGLWIFPAWIVKLVTLALMWVHVQRAPKAATQPPRPIALALLVTLLVLALVAPVASQGP